MSFAYLGHHTLDVYHNMALDEVLLDAAAEENMPFIRFYSFEQPSIVLAYVQHADDVRMKGKTECEVTRRISQGSTIFCDNNTIAYALYLPESAYGSPTEAHQQYGNKIVRALEELGVSNVRLGDSYSVKVNDGVIAGHGQRWRQGRSGLYHGLLALSQWDVDFIEEAIMLREGEADIIRALPALDQFVSASMPEVRSSLLSHLTDDAYERRPLDTYLEAAEQRVADTYAHDTWIYQRSPRLKRQRGFCFIPYVQ